jgi:ORMDL family protein
MADRSGRRRRSSSILQVHYEPAETLEQISDQAIVPNLNANWVNAKGKRRPSQPTATATTQTIADFFPPAGAWTIHFVLIAGLKIFYDIIPGVSQETSWTLTNITYMVGSYIMFHYVRGVPFDFNGGAFDNLNMWEQIDDGAQYTPAKKFLLSVPIMLFLLSTHYTHYDLAYFIINFMAVLAVVIPKLPFVRTPRPAPSQPLGTELSQLTFISAEPQNARWTIPNYPRRLGPGLFSKEAARSRWGGNLQSREDL